VTAWLAGAASRVGLAGLAGRLLGSPVASRLGVLEPTGPSLAGARCNPGHRGVLAMALVTVVTVLVAGGWVLAARPRPMLAANDSTSTGSPVSGGGSSSQPPAPGGSLKSPLAGRSGPVASASGSAPVVVDVAGKVRRPGLYRLPAGSRVDDAVRAAGGLLAGVHPALVNLARKLADGEQLLIGLAPPAGGNAGGSATPGGSAGQAGPGAPAAGGPLDLNSATLAQLDALPGVGPVLAQRILDWRVEHGRFDSVEQLRGISGIGDSKYADLKSLVGLG
jgi:competence protein ComEA